MPCLDLWNPRLFGEVVATIILAEDRAPKSGPHSLHFAALQAVNARWAQHPRAGLACLAHADFDKINQALEVTTSGLRVDRAHADGRLEVSYRPPLARLEPGGRGEIQVGVAIALRLWADDEAGRGAFADLAAAAAREALRSFGGLDGPDGWRAYRDQHRDGRLGADLAELISGLLADALPSQAYELIDITTVAGPAAGVA